MANSKDQILEHGQKPDAMALSPDKSTTDAHMANEAGATTMQSEGASHVSGTNSITAKVQTSAQSAEQAVGPATGQVTEQATGQLFEQATTSTQAVGNAVGQAAEQVATQAATAPMPMESAFTWGGYFQAIGTLLILLAVLWGVVWLVRRYGRFNFLPKPGAFPRDGLRLESQLPLGPRKGLMVVRFLNKRLLLGVTDHQITLLKETADEDDKNNMDFKDVMEMAQRQKSDD